MSQARARRVLEEAAMKDCPECGGEGVVCVLPHGDPDREEDVACDCAKHALVGLDEPHDKREAE